MSGKIITRMRERQERATRMRHLLSLESAFTRRPARPLMKTEPGSPIQRPYAITRDSNYAAAPITRFFARLFRL